MEFTFCAIVPYCLNKHINTPCSTLKDAIIIVNTNTYHKPSIIGLHNQLSNVQNGAYLSKHIGLSEGLSKEIS